jgi:hypothetical protein
MIFYNTKLVHLGIDKILPAYSFFILMGAHRKIDRSSYKKLALINKRRIPNTCFSVPVDHFRL